MLISEDKLRSFGRAIFKAMSCEESVANEATEVLLMADLRGIDSHGFARLPGYVRLWEKGRINSRPDIKIIHESLSTASVDGDAGWGLQVGPYAMRLAIEKAKKVGSGWVSVSNSNHFGIATYHAMLAQEDDMIGIAMTNASPLVAPTFSKERMLGTNPICFVFPAKKYPPIVIDMATSAAANGKLEIAQRENKKIPKGWLKDKDGKDSEDPSDLKAGGFLLPLGSDKEHGSHKGYGLSAAVDIFSGVLSGANFGPWVPPFVSFLEPRNDLVGKGLGHFFGAMQVDGFRKKEDYFNAIDTWINRFKNSERIEESNPVLIPGEPETMESLLRKKEGIPLNDLVIKDLETLATKFSIPF